MSDALKYYQEFIRDHEHDAASRHDLAKGLLTVGDIGLVSGSPAEALEALGRAVELLESLATEDAASNDYRRDLGAAYHELGLVQFTIGRPEAASESYAKALAIRKRFCAEEPNVANYQRELADTHHRLSVLKRQAGQPDTALENCRQALKILEKLAADDPENLEQVHALAVSCNDLARLQKSAGEQDLALASYQRALTILQSLASRNPTNANYQDDLTSGYANICIWHQEFSRDRVQAMACCQDALAIREKLAEENPLLAGFRDKLAGIYCELGTLLFASGDRAGGASNYERAVAIMRKLIDERPEVADYRLSLAGIQCNLAHLEQAQGQSPGAIERYSQAMETLSNLLAREPRHDRGTIFLRNAHVGRGIALSASARFSEAADDLRRAIELDDGGLGVQLRVRLADTLGRAGDHARAAAEADELGGIDHLPADVHYNLACVLALCSAAVKDDAALADWYATRALELLACARSAGFFNDAANVEHLAKDPDLKALHERDDFKKFVDELKGPIQPKDQ